jgi:DNA polymerase III delta subunit
MNEKKIPRLAIVAGDDNFEIERSRDMYRKSIEARHGQECAVEVFDAHSERMDMFMARAMTASLFQEIRLYCVLHAQTLSEKDLTALDASLNCNMPEVYVFISVETDKKNRAAETKVTKALQLKKRQEDASVSIRNVSKPPDYELAGWIAQRVPELYNRQIGPAEAKFLAETVEYDLIYSELQKIDLALEPGARIDRKTILEITGATRAMNVTDLANALSGRDLPAALNVLDWLFSTHSQSSFPAPLVVHTLFERFWALLRIKKFLEKNPAILRQYNTRGYSKDSPQTMAAIEIGIAAGLLTEKTKNRVYPVIMKSGIVAQSQSFDELGLRDILKMLQRFDVEIKTGKTTSDPCNLQMLCYRIVRAA